MLLAFALTSLAAAGVKVGDPAPAFALPSFDGTTVTLEALQGKGEEKKVVVVDFWSTNCPWSIGWDPTLKKLHETFQGRGVAFVAIDPNFNETKEEIERYAKEKGIAFPVLLDPDQKVCDQYGGKTTPHVFVAGRDGKIAYIGAVDSNTDRSFQTTEGITPYLHDALEAILAGKPVEPSTTKEIGCSVKREKAAGRN